MPRTEEARMVNYKNYLVKVVSPPYFICFWMKLKFSWPVFCMFFYWNGVYMNYAHKLDLFTYR